MDITGIIVWSIWILLGFMGYGLLKGFWMSYFSWKPDLIEELIFILCGLTGLLSLIIAFVYTFLEGDGKLRFRLR